MKNLFEITETVALKEINTDAKGFITRETVNRLSRRPEYNESILKPDKLEDCQLVITKNKNRSQLAVDDDVFFESDIKIQITDDKDKLLS